jgi:hypothetical protein
VEHNIGCDAHQRYSVFVTMDEKGKAGTPVRVDHNDAAPTALREITIAGKTMDLPLYDLSQKTVRLRFVNSVKPVTIEVSF